MLRYSYTAYLVMVTTLHKPGVDAEVVKARLIP